MKQFPKDAEQRIKPLGADGEPTDFEPSYDAFFPEYAATAIQTETVMRDIGPGPNAIYDVAHGQLARTEDGKPAPVGVWLTEMGVSPALMGIADRQVAERLKTKFCLRTVLFYIGIGAERVYLFNAVGDSRGHALIDEAAPGVPTLPLQVLTRMLGLLDLPEHQTTAEVPLRHLSFMVYPSPPDAKPIFQGGDSPQTPPLRGSDCLVLLPFQSDTRRFAIAYYVMTRDIRTERPPERLSIVIRGVRGMTAQVRALEIEVDRQVPCTIRQREADRLTLELEASDMPRLLLVHEDEPT